LGAGLIEESIMESWRKVWREGFAPLLPTVGLMALRDALSIDDHRILQGVTTSPPAMLCVQDWPIEGSCVLGFCAWQGEGLDTVGEIEEFFARTCLEADQHLGELAACRYFVNWYDDTPRAEMRSLLLEEVEQTLAQRIPVADDRPRAANQQIAA
jgi:hypothetical protein